MISRVSEKKLHNVRLILAGFWLILIASLFYDPISHYLTIPGGLLAPRVNQICVKIQDVCFNEKPYKVGARIWWNYVIPSAIMILLVFGHEFWRRICPLYFFSQIPRALGLKPLLNIEKNQWLVRNHLYLQFTLLFLGLVLRILLINSERTALGLFLILTILSAITAVYVYGGRSFCHYFCPFSPVQTALIGERGLLESQDTTFSHDGITHSMCRTIDKTSNKEISACIGCKLPCKDIDGENAYWQELSNLGRKLVQYGYLGLVIGFFAYQVLYAGNFDYYFSGAWHHQDNVYASLSQSGFYLFNQAIPIPKWIAVPSTLGAFVWVSYAIGIKLEKLYLADSRRKNLSISKQQVKHRVFSIFTFISYNFFFVYGGRGEILRLPLVLQFGFQGLVILLTTFWLCRTWNRNQKISYNERPENVDSGKLSENLKLEKQMTNKQQKTRTQLRFPSTSSDRNYADTTIKKNR